MIKSITSVKVSGRRVIVRVGFDVPLKENSAGELVVADDTRIRDALATIKHLIDQRARIVIVSHLGRPEGWQKEKSLWPAALKLGELINYKVVKIQDKLPDYYAATIHFLSSDITKKDYASLVTQILPGDILFLENIRFYPEEEKNDADFVSTLAKYGDVYVNEAFSVAHRKEASTFGLATKLPHYAGISLLKEIQSLTKILQNPQQPFIAIIGGIKIDDKVDTIHNLAKHAQKILVGGGVATSFQKAKGFEVGQSKYADVHLAKQLLRDYKSKIVLPIDVVVSKNEESHPRVVMVDKVLPEETILDLGPESLRKFSEYIKTAKTLIWNGPMGKIENPKYAFGSKGVAVAVASRSKGKAFGVVGGGETVEAVDMAKVSQFIDHVSTGGGAMLEFLAGKELLAIKALASK